MKRFLSRYLILGLVFVLAFAVCVSCSNKKGDNKPQENKISSRTSTASGDNKGSPPISNVVVQNLEAQKASPEQKQKSTFQMQKVVTENFDKSSPISNQYNTIFFPIKPYSRIVPSDFKIGKLIDYSSIGIEERGMLNTLTAFFGSLLKGEINKDSISESEYLKIFRIISPSIAQIPPTDYRIGQIKMSGKEDSSAPVRVFSKAGSAYGSVYLTKKETSWLVNDVQIDFEDYSPDAVNEKFMPSAYNEWMY